MWAVSDGGLLCLGLLILVGLFEVASLEAEPGSRAERLCSGAAWALVGVAVAWAMWETSWTR